MRKHEKMTRSSENEIKESGTISNNEVKNELIRIKIREYKTMKKKRVKKTRSRNKRETRNKMKSEPEQMTQRNAPKK